MYTILSRIPRGQDLLRKKFEACVADGLVDTLAPIRISTVYVKVFLPIYKKYSEIITMAFMGDAKFVASLNKAFRSVINGKAATMHSPMILAAILATHLDKLLRRKNKSPEDDTEATTKQIVS
jgi:cullin 1